MIPVILSGGSGSRLWPLSRQARPKQFWSLTEEYSLLQSTLLRLDGLDQLAEPLIVCNEEHRFIVAEQLRQKGLRNQGIILESEGRDTSAAIALAALKIADQNPDESLLVLPSDHVISDVPGFHAAIVKANKLAKQGRLVTFGVVPTSPECGYGYIKTGTEIFDEPGCYDVASFVEKPVLEVAERYLEEGGYLWNGGMFLFKASRYLNELEKFHSDIYSCCRTAMQNQTQDVDFIRPDQNAFTQSPSVSVDYAVMEKTGDAAVVPLDAGWNDVGAWSSVWKELPKDTNNNATRGKVVTHSSKNCLAISENRLVTLCGLENTVVIETADAILVTTHDEAQSVKQVVNELKSRDMPEATEHRRGYRPWGDYDCIDHGRRFQVKRITVKPGAKLSLQMHHHRAEHWIVVSGTARVRCGDDEFLLTENQSSYIPLGELHQLSNPGKFDLELIEVQSGAYLGEDDIERFEDDYGRV